MTTASMTSDMALDLHRAEPAAKARREPFSGGFIAWISQAMAARRATAELAALDDHLLRDIGMSPAEIGRVRATRTELPCIWS